MVTAPCSNSVTQHRCCALPCAGVDKLVRGLDPDLPWLITDNVWWDGQHPNPDAARCLPCNFEVDVLAKLVGTKINVSVSSFCACGGWKARMLDTRQQRQHHVCAASPTCSPQCVQYELSLVLAAHHSECSSHSKMKGLCLVLPATLCTRR